MTDTPKLGAPFEAQFHAGRAQEWMIQRLIRQIHTSTLVKVVAVYPTTGTVGFVDVRPMVQQQATDGVLIDSNVMYRLPYLRLQGGVSAVILDPAVDDIGMAAFAERDLTTVIATRAEGPAATNRAFDAGDGLYLGGFLNADPTQFIEFLPDAAGVRVVTPGDLTLDVAGDLTAEVGGSMSVNVAGDLTAEVGGDLGLTVGGSISVSATATTWAGPVTFSSPITAPAATIGGIPFAAHKHISAASGSPTGTPIT